MNFSLFWLKLQIILKVSEKSNKNNYHNDIKKIMKHIKTENKNLTDKYESILYTKKKDILSQNNYYNNISINFKKEKEKYYNELIELFKIFSKLISSHEKIFMKDVSIFYKKNMVLEIINLEEGKINLMNYPVLYEYIEKNEDFKTHEI